MARAGPPEVVADLAVMPGTGEGKPPPLIGILRQYGFAPLVLLTAAAIVPDTFGNGISLIGTNLEHTFHIHDAALGAVTFVAAVAQLLWAVPLALWADRGSRKVVAGVALLVFSAGRAADGPRPQRVGVHLPLPGGLGGVQRQRDRPQLVPVRRLSHRGPGPGLQLAQPLGPAVPDHRHPLLRPRRRPSGTTGGGGCSSPWPAIPIALSLFTLREPDKGQNESSHILKASGMDIHAQQGEAPRVLLGSAVTRLLRIRSIYFELVAVAILGFAGTGGPLFGNLYFVRRWGLDTAQRSEVYSIIGLAAFLGLPVAYVIGDRMFRRAPERPLVIAGICITAYGVALRRPRSTCRSCGWWWPSSSWPRRRSPRWPSASS